MKCDELLSALNDYVDGDLDPAICAEFRAHLSDCGPCQIVIDNIRQTITLYKSGRPIALPKQLQEHLFRVLRARWEARFPFQKDPPGGVPQHGDLPSRATE
jgi:anti-sigma factor RsiW